MRIILLQFLIMTMSLCSVSHAQQVFGTYFGGNLSESTTDIVRDDDGNIYIAGQTFSNNFPISNNAFQSSLAGNSDCFLLKMSSSYELLWSTYFGGTGEEYFSNITFQNGNIFFTGTTNSAEGIATPGAFSESHNGSFDIMVGAFDTNGNLLWSTYYGSTGDEKGNAICIDGDHLFISGQTTSSSEFVTDNAIDQTMDGNADCFILSLSTSGQPNYCSYIGGNLIDESTALTTDPLHNIYLSGNTNSEAEIATNGAFQTTNHGLNDAFLVKLDQNFNVLWATYFGGESNDVITDMAIISGNEILLYGQTQSSEYIVQENTFQNAFGGGIYDSFISQFSSDGIFSWSSYVGGSGTEYAGKMQVINDQIYISGSTGSTDFPLSANAFMTDLTGNTDLFFSRFDVNHNYVYGSYYGGSNSEYGGVILLNAGQIYLAGSTTSINGIATADAFQTTNAGGLGDGFFAVLSLFTGVDETNSSAIIVYPNPCKESCTLVVDHDIKKLSVYSERGALLKSISGMKQNITTIDFTGQPAGKYFIRYETDDKISSAVILVE